MEHSKSVCKVVLNHSGNEVSLFHSQLLCPDGHDRKPSFMRSGVPVHIEEFDNP